MAKDINNDNSFWIRFRSSVILMIITIGTVVAGGYVLLGVLGIISLIGLTELYKVVEADKKPAAFVGYLASILWYLLMLPFWGDYSGLKVMPLFVAVFTVLLLGCYVFGFKHYNSESITMIFFGFFYVALTLSYIYLVRTSDGGAYSVWLIFIGSWGSDTCAYMVGRKIGKHKIAPVLSPKKSLEGCIGGIVGAGLIGVIYALIFKSALSEAFSSPVLTFAIVGAVSGFVSMIGDMAASGIKRNKNIKDYGKLIPGHGGILDRFDSVIFIAPIVYYLLQILR